MTTRRSDRSHPWGRTGSLIPSTKNPRLVQEVESGWSIVFREGPFCEGNRHLAGMDAQAAAPYDRPDRCRLPSRKVVLSRSRSAAWPPPTRSRTGRPVPGRRRAWGPLGRGRRQDCPTPGLVRRPLHRDPRPRTPHGRRPPRGRRLADPPGRRPRSRRPSRRRAGPGAGQGERPPRVVVRVHHLDDRPGPGRTAVRQPVREGD